MTIAIPSNDGWGEVRFDLARYAEGVLRVEMESRFWDRSVDPKDAELFDDGHIILSQVAVRPRAMSELQRALARWLEHRSRERVELGQPPDQSLCVEIGSREDLISSSDRPVLLIQYSDARLSTSLKILVDESCVKIACDQLRKLGDG